MSSLGDDCYFFCTSSCNKGAACPFRHVESAKTAKLICQHWQMGNCLRPLCKYRHSEFMLQADVTETPCYWESAPTGCLRLNCSYKHSKPRPQSASPATGSVNDVPPTVSNSESSETAAAAATPVALEKSESEKSCPSPGKQPDKPETAVVEGNKVEEAASVGSQGNETPRKGVKRKESPVADNTKADKNMKRKKKTAVTTKADAEPSRKNGSKTSARPSVKARLGAPPVTASVPHKTSSSSDSDSEDSIENIKVMSMEEIFRQKALESMLKKRAEGKIPVSTSSSSNQIEKKEPSIDESSSSSKESTSDSSSSSEEIQVPDESESSEDSSSQSSTESSDSEEESAEDFEPDVRRVVVEVDVPKLTKKKAFEDSAKQSAALKMKKTNRSKVSSAKKQRNVQASKKRMVDVDYDSDDLVSCRVTQPLVLNVHERLGKSQPQSTSPLKSVGRNATSPLKSVGRNATSPLKSAGRNAGLVSLSKRVVSVEAKKEVDVKPVRSKKGKEPNPVAEIKVKTLEEIKQEKLRKLASEIQQDSLDASPVKQTTPLSSTVSSEEKDIVKKRVVLLTEDSQSEEVTNSKSDKNLKRLKKFAQRKKNLIPDEPSLPENERNVLASGIIKLESPSAGVSAQGNTEPDDRTVEAGKKHKHKHRQRDAKKPKTERQIYVPPAMKNAERNQEPVQTIVIKKEPVAPTAPQRKERHPMAAIWAAGLSVSSKGAHKLDVNRGGNLQPPVVEKRDIRERIGLGKSLSLTKTVSPAKDIKVPSKATEASDSTQVTIKSFSEIMSEKRRRRLEMQSQKTGPENPSANQVTPPSFVERPQLAGAESKPKVAIKPIVFDLVKNSLDDSKQREDLMGDLGPSRTTSQANRLFQQASKENNSASSCSDLEQISHRDKLNSSSNELNKKNPKLFKRKKSFESAGNSGQPKTFDSNVDSLKTSALTSSQDTAAEHQHSSTPSHSHRNTVSLHTPASSRLSTQPETTVSTTLARPASGTVHHTQDTFSSGDPEPTKKKSRLSLEDEFNFFEDENYDYTGAVNEDVEPIDDLLQDIDDLLS